MQSKFGDSRLTSCKMDVPKSCVLIFGPDPHPPGSKASETLLQRFLTCLRTTIAKARSVPLHWLSVQSLTDFNESQLGMKYDSTKSFTAAKIVSLKQVLASFLMTQNETRRGGEV